MYNRGSGPLQIVGWWTQKAETNRLNGRKKKKIIRMISYRRTLQDENPGCKDLVSNEIRIRGKDIILNPRKI